MLIYRFFWKHIFITVIVRLKKHDSVTTAEGEGYIEISNNGGLSWGGVCDDYYGIVDAHVFCRMAGFTLG